MTTIPAPLLALSVFNAADAARAGVDDRTLRRALGEGSLTRVQRGWYTPAGQGRPVDHYRARCVAAQRTLGLPLSHVSALVHHGLPTYATARRPVYLVGPGEARRTRGDVRVTAALPDGPVLAPDGMAVTIEEALLTTALVDPELALGAADAAARAGQIDHARLVAQSPRLVGRPGAMQARSALGLVDGRRESVGESRVAWLGHVWGFELEPQVGVALPGRIVYPDFRIKGTRVLLEFDGLAKYDDPSVLAREKLREDDLRRAGWVVVRITWADLYHPAELLTSIRAALALAAGSR